LEDVVEEAVEPLDHERVAGGDSLLLRSGCLHACKYCRQALVASTRSEWAVSRAPASPAAVSRAWAPALLTAHCSLLTAFLRQSDLIVGGRTRLSDRQMRRRYLLRHRFLGTGLHRVGARLERLLDLARVERVYRAHADGGDVRAVEGERVRAVVWFETRITTGPAPMRDGDTVTLLLVITPLSCTGTGGRGLSWKSLPPPQPTPTSPATGRLSRSAATRLRPNPPPSSLSARNPIRTRRIRAMPEAGRPRSGCGPAPARRATAPARGRRRPPGRSRRTTPARGSGS